MKIREMLKKLAAPLIAGAVILGGIGGVTIAQSLAASQNQNQKQQVEEESPKYKSSISVDEQNQEKDDGKDGAAEKQENAALAGKAKITKDEAVKAAQTDQPGSTVQEAGLENENGNLAYEVKMSDQSGKTVEVKVDAGNGKVLAVESEGEQD
jgi:uncharacterized membrane protein YkoI